MILRRVANALRTQNWTAICIELAIVIIGVFVGTQVANWNEQRLEKRQTERLLAQLQPELHNFIDFFDSAKIYYATTRSYANVAFAAWEGRENVSDEQFVIAAYQASQVFGIGTNGENWALIFGGQQLRNIDDLEIRRNLSFLMTSNYDDLDIAAVSTHYRENVRRVIPDEVQEAIRNECGDRTPPGRPFVNILSRTCDLDLTAQKSKAIAAALRANPQLVGDLRWHLAAVATFLANMNALEVQTRDLTRRIDGLR